MDPLCHNLCNCIRIERPLTSFDGNPALDAHDRAPARMLHVCVGRVVPQEVMVHLFEINTSCIHPSKSTSCIHSR